MINENKFKFLIEYDASKGGQLTEANILPEISQEDGKAILIHTSNKKITDGYIKVGMTPNSYSNMDFKTNNTPRAYFWGNGIGQDPSIQNSIYHYYCELSLNLIYDYQNNPKNYQDIDTIIKDGYKAIAYYLGGNKEWGKGIKHYGLVVVSFESLPIKYIKEEVKFGPDKFYNNKWKLINVNI